MEGTERAYAAGIIDGEGCIEIIKWQDYRNSKYKKPYGPRYIVAVEVHMADIEVVKWLQERLGAAIKTKIPKNPRHRTCYHWVLYSKRAFNFLQEIKDFIVLKKEQIRIVEEFMKLPREDRENLYLQMHKANRRGVE